MSKIEILKNYAAEQSAPQLAIVAAIRDLQELTEQLPRAVAAEISQALQPLAALSGMEDLLSQQRRSVELISREMLDAAELAISPITEASEAMRQQSTAARKAVEQVSQQAAALTKVAARFDPLTRRVQSAAQQIEAGTAAASRREWWQMLTVALIAGLIAGTVVLIGAYASGPPAPAAHVQQMRPPAPAAPSSARPAR